MEATVRLIDDEPNVAVQVVWRGAEFNLLRSREEPVGRFLQRLGLSCTKLSGRQAGGPDKKRAKKDKRGRQQQQQSQPQQQTPDASAPAADVGKPDAGQAQDAGVDSADAVAPPAEPPPPRLLDSRGERVPDEALVGEALLSASHVEIQGELLPIVVNPPSITRMEIFGKPLAGCPLTATLRCEFCRPDDFDLRWLQLSGAGSDQTSKVVGQGRVFWVPEDAPGQTVALRADASRALLCGRARSSACAGVVERVPEGWPDRRLAAFGARAAEGGAIRVVCYNILAVCYARTQSAVKDMYPYCPAQALDLAYRQPLIGRELNRLDGDLVFLQECGYSIFHKNFAPLFSDRYDMRISLKATRVSEGCALFIRRGAFQVLEEQDALFRNIFRTSETLRPLFREVVAKWPDFLTAILPRMSTIFQLSAVRHTATGQVIVLANTHLFFHPLARHIRLLQAMCLLQLVQEMRERHREANPGGQLPRCIVCGDFNASPDSAAAELFLRGEIPSDHKDWQFSSQFAWREEDDGLSEAGGEEEACGQPISNDGVEVDLAALEPLPQAAWQPGAGVALRNPTGTLSDAYVGSGLRFTNYVRSFSATLDYIMTGGGWRVTRVLPGVSEEELKPHGGLPSVLHPSDHLSIAADLELAEP